MQNFILQVHSKAEEFAARYKLKVYEAAFCRQNRGVVLQVYLDGNVSLDSCVEISKLLSNWLDSVDAPTSRYTLEVSSLGIDRPLKSEAEFAAHIGKICRLTVRTGGVDGRKRYKGRIVKVEGGEITLRVEEESRDFVISAVDIAKANLIG
ncbi:MAG: ribosome maturation factor RimP [Deferribacteraceae bacterium]|jgi:ribosome maturation factor RimP|nr:ribosome maturation factor RimP [Deferribacteraceae bacterium]